MPRMNDTEMLIVKARLAQGMTEEEARRNKEFTEWARSLRSTVKTTAFIYGVAGLIIGSTFPWLLGN